jgi:hypothetical protein
MSISLSNYLSQSNLKSRMSIWLLLVNVLSVTKSWLQYSLYSLDLFQLSFMRLWKLSKIHSKNSTNIVGLIFFIISNSIIFLSILQSMQFWDFKSNSVIKLKTNFSVWFKFCITEIFDTFFSSSSFSIILCYSLNWNVRILSNGIFRKISENDCLNFKDYICLTRMTKMNSTVIIRYNIALTFSLYFSILKQNEI